MRNWESNQEPSPETPLETAPTFLSVPLPDSSADSLPPDRSEEPLDTSEKPDYADPTSGAPVGTTNTPEVLPSEESGAAASGPPDSVSNPIESNNLAESRTEKPQLEAVADGTMAAEKIRLPIYRDFNLLQLAAIVFLIDQLTKFLTRAYLPFGHSFPFDGFFRFTHTHNTGSAFGILQGQNTPLIFVSFIGILVLVMIYQSQLQRTNLLRFSLGLQIGGALGNLIDRLRLGSVTDFIDVGPWPVFNLADASIVTGLIILAWILLRSSRGGNSSEATSVAPLVPMPDANSPQSPNDSPGLDNGFAEPTVDTLPALGQVENDVERPYGEPSGADDIDGKDRPG